MAGGKQTPRQKMIGMMYLVLTALLALNVSKTVLDAFVLVDQGLQQTNRNFERNIDLLYSSFDEQLKNNPERVQDYYDKAQQAREYTNELASLIREWRAEMISVVDGIPIEVADTMFLLNMKAKDNYSASSNFWLMQPVDGGNAATIEAGGPNTRAYILKEKIIEYKSDLLSLLPEEYSDMNIGLEVEGTFTDSHGVEAEWQMAMFDRMIPVAAATNLSRLVTEVRNAEFDVVRALFESIGSGTFTFDVVEARVIPESRIVIQGDYFEADVLVAAYDSKQNPIVTLGGRTLEDGKIRIPATSEGLQKYSGTISVKGPDGPIVRDFDIDFIVQKPSATVSADAMNVFYMGVDNPVSVSVPGIPTGALEPRISGAGNQLIPRPGGGYIVRLSQNHNINQNVTISAMARLDGELRNMGDASFRVRVVPDPYPEIAGQTEGTISKEILAGAPIIPRMKDFDFKMDFRITSFSMNTTVTGDFLEWRATSNVQTEDMTNAIRRAVRGQRFTFQDIKAVGDDGRQRNLPPMVFRIQ